MEETQGIEIKALVAVLRKRKWSVILALCLAVAAATAYIRTATPIYEAGTRLLVSPLPLPDSLALQPVDVQTEAQLIRSEQVATRVSAALSNQATPSTLLTGISIDSVTATVPFAAPGPQVLVLIFKSPDPVLAADAVNEFADKYMKFRAKRALETFQSEEKIVQKRIEVVTEELDQVTAGLAEATADEDAPLATALDSQRASLVARLTVLQQRLDDLQPSSLVKSGGVQLLQAAITPSAPASPNRPRVMLLCVLLGLGLGVGLALLRERLDDRFHSRADVEEVLRVPALGSIPMYKTGKRGRFKPAVLTDPSSPTSEAYRTLRTNLEFTAAQHDLRSIVVSSAAAGEGKSATSANLGIALAQAGRRVILLSADLRRPTLERYFGLEAPIGLSTLLISNQCSLAEVIKDVGIPNLRVIPCGPVPPSPAELLTTHRLATVIKALESKADFVLIDSPPILAVTDAAILASRASGALLVVEAASTHRSASKQAREQLSRAGGNRSGSCSTDSTRRRSRTTTAPTTAMARDPTTRSTVLLRPR
jgi:capsular exopolysaccharide synthesis family protein